MKRSIYFGAAAGALVGYGEAVYTIRAAKLYFTVSGMAGLIMAAVLIYGAYGAFSCALLFPPWRRVWKAAPERALVASAATAWCLLYGLSYVTAFFANLPWSKNALLQPRFLLLGLCVVLVSLPAAFALGCTLGRLIQGRRAVAGSIAVTAVITAALLVPVGRRAAPAGEMPDMVLVTMDTLRADRLHSYGNDRVRTPTMDRVASEGVLFENAVSQIPLTNPSHLCILSSMYPHQHGAMGNRYRHSGEIPKIVHELKKRGYGTAAFVSSITLDSCFGFAHGFDVYDDDLSRLKGVYSLSAVRVSNWLLRNIWGPFQRTAGQTNRDAVSWLRRRARSPFFLWVHYFDPHGPYTPPSPYSGMYYEGVRNDPANRSMAGVRIPAYWPASARDFTDIEYPLSQYDAEVTYTDAELGKLLEELDRVSEDYILVVVGDHGESLTEHGCYFDHGLALYEEQIDVPLIIRRKGSIEAARVSSLVETVDIVPTVMELAGFEAPAWCSGESLVPLMRGEGRRAREGALISTGLRRPDWSMDIAYRTDRYKLILKPGGMAELYDLERDPGEMNDISGERKDLVEEYGEKIRAMLESRSDRSVAVMDGEMEERLRSLGYIR